MKREIRPFVVEVRRGSKKQSAPFLPSPPEPEEKQAQARPEDALFSREAASPPPLDPPRTGRVLRSIEEEVAPPEPPAVEDGPAPSGKRRGRPRGSVNRAKAADPASSGSRRGRPKSGPEGRRLALTPELVDEALRSMERIAAPSAGVEAEAEPVASEPAPRRFAPTRVQPSAMAESEVARPSARHRRSPRAARIAALDSEMLADLPRLFKLGERWRGRALARALARRRLRAARS